MAPPVFAAAANHKIFPRTVDGPAMQAFKLDGYHLMYPGDSSAPGYLVYNCRCTTVAVVDGVDTGDAMRRARDPETGQNVLVEDMSYAEWVRWKKEAGKTYRLSGKVGDTDGYSKIDEVLAFNFSDKAAVRKVVELFSKNYANAKEEHAVVISPVGQLFKLTGTKGSVNTALVGTDALVGSIGMHNHPVWEGFDSGDSFSKEDVMFSAEYKTGTEYLTTGNKRYSFEYTGTLTADQLKEKYTEARNFVRSVAFETGSVLEFEQEEIMRVLAKELEGFVFNENL